MSQESQTEPGQGNTKPAPNQCKSWVFTWNNYPSESYELLKAALIPRAEKCMWEKEVAPTTGTPHIQGWVVLKKKGRWSEFKLPKEIRWDTMKGSVEANIVYCKKTGSDVFVFPDNLLETEKSTDPLDLIEFPPMDYPWQAEIINELKKKPDKRKVFWLWDPVGNTGKTEFAKYLCVKMFRNKSLYISGKATDMKFGVAALFAKTKRYPELLILGCPRTHKTVDFSGVEQLKDAFFFSEKYESGMIIGERPHFIILANCYPKDKSSLSEDRWKIGKINQKKEIEWESKEIEYAMEDLD